MSLDLSDAHVEKYMYFYNSLRDFKEFKFLMYLNFSVMHTFAIV